MNGAASDALPLAAGMPRPDGRTFSEPLHRIRDIHIEVESILQSLAALQDDPPCARCTSVCCKEVMCRESIDSDFLRFLLGPRINDYSVDAGWYAPGAGCRLGFGRPLVCYEFFCEKFDAEEWAQLKQLSRDFKTLYVHAFAGQHMLVVEDINRITAYKLAVMHGWLEQLRDRANEALRYSLGRKLRMQSAGTLANAPGFPGPVASNPN